MRAVWKFPIGVDEGAQKVSMPTDAEILSVGLEGKTLVLWAVVSTDAVKRARTIEIVRTGVEIAPPARRIFIGTVSAEEARAWALVRGVRAVHQGSIGTLVWHVFERLEEAK